MSLACKSRSVRMGVPVSKPTDEQKKQHQAAEKVLAADKQKAPTTFKLLLLGTGDSGKSTIVKQMKILHKNGFDKDELNRQHIFIVGNILQSISAIVTAMPTMGIKFECLEREMDAVQILAFSKEWKGVGAFTFEIWASLKRLWADGGVQACFQRAHEYQLSDSTKYFCDNIDRISAVDFVPNEQDMLRARVSTLGIVEIDFNLRGLNVVVIDVGGQRSQRKKWIHCFENVNGLIFVVAISEYNQALFEDNSVNRIHESLKLFSTIINCQWFKKTSVVLFLNKKDLFEEKIKTFPLTMAFPEYTKGQEYEPAVSFVQNKFESQKEDAKKVIYTHRTCATDTKNVEFVMDACFDIMLTKNMARSGLY